MAGKKSKKEKKEEKNRNFRREGEKIRAKFWAVQGKGGPAEEGEDPQILNTPTTPTTHTHTHQPPTSTKRHQEAPTGNNRHQQATTRNNNNNRKFGQHIENAVWPKCCQHFEIPILTKCGFAVNIVKHQFWPNSVWPNAGMTSHTTSSPKESIHLLASPHVQQRQGQRPKAWIPIGRTKHGAHAVAKEEVLGHPWPWTTGEGNADSCRTSSLPFRKQAHFHPKSISSNDIFNQDSFIH